MKNIILQIQQGNKIAYITKQNFKESVYNKLQKFNSIRLNSLYKISKPPSSNGIIYFLYKKQYYTFALHDDNYYTWQDVINTLECLG